jgi:hypothetical protein
MVVNFPNVTASDYFHVEPTILDHSVIFCALLAIIELKIIEIHSIDAFL